MAVRGQGGRAPRRVAAGLRHADHGDEPAVAGDVRRSPRRRLRRPVRPRSHRGGRGRSSGHGGCGDLSENGDYHAAKDEQGHMEGRIRQLDAHARERRDHRRPAAEGVVEARQRSSRIVYDGDTDDQAERYLDRLTSRSGVDGLDVVQPALAARRRADRATSTAHAVAYQAPNGDAARPGRCTGLRRGLTTRVVAVGLPPAPRPGARVTLPGAGRRAVSASFPDRPARPRSCSSTGGRRPPTSTSWHVLRGARGAVPRLAFDHRGHGRGIRSRRKFRLEDCADDVAAMADVVELDTFVPVGYSMGGAVAQLVWRRHPERVDGLGAGRYRAGLQRPAHRAALVPRAHRPRRTRPTDAGPSPPVAHVAAVPAAQDADVVGMGGRAAATHDWRMVLEAGRAIGTFRSDDWLAEIDVPTSVIVTMTDEGRPTATADPAVRGLSRPPRRDGSTRARCRRRPARPIRPHPRARLPRGRRHRGSLMSRWGGRGSPRSRSLGSPVGSCCPGAGGRGTDATARPGPAATPSWACIGLAVGSTDAPTGARKVFAAADRHDELDAASSQRRAGRRARWAT